MKQLAFLLTIGLAFSGCMGTSGYNYSQSSYNQLNMAEYGTVMEIRDVEVGDSGVGTALGAVLGGVAGTQIGGGRGKDLATVGGAILGGVAGNQMNKNSAQELTIKLDSGAFVTAVNKVESGNPFTFRVGDRARIVYSGNEVRRVEPVR